MNIDGLIYILVAIMFGPTIVLAIIGIILILNQKRKAAKVFFILSVVYQIISLGVCGAIIYS